MRTRGFWGVLVVVLVVMMAVTISAQSAGGGIVGKPVLPPPVVNRAQTAEGGSGSFTDPRDNKNYRTVRIGNRTWMAENLNHQTEGSWCYGDDPSNCDKYGRLYTWEAAMGGSSSSEANPSGVRGVCPVGWHLPSDAEWTELVNAINTSATSTNNAGTKLKSTSGWNSGGNGTDDFGFSALPGGYRLSDGGFSNVGSSGRWWSATEGDATGARGRLMYNSGGGVRDYRDGKTRALSVRCVMDTIGLR